MKEFINFLFPNNLTIFSLSIKNGLKMYKEGNKYLLLGLYPVYKHHWINLKLVKNDNNYIFLSLDINPNLNIILYNDFKNMTIEYNDEDKYIYTIKNNNKIYTIHYNAYSYIKLHLKYFKKFNILNIYKNDKDIGYGIIHDICYYNYASSFIKDYSKNYQFNFEINNLKSLKLENQLHILKIFLNRENCVITGGTGIGKTSQIPKLFWWFNMLFDGYIFFNKPYNINSDFIFDTTSIKYNYTILGLPRKVLILSNAMNIIKSLGFNNIKGSPVNCLYKDVKQTEFYNSLPLNKNIFLLSVNRLLLNNQMISNSYIIDEIHEHDDFALITISILYKKNKNIRNLILMTATLEDDYDRIKKYFKNITFIHIPGDTLFTITTQIVPYLDYKKIILDLYKKEIFKVNTSIIIFKATKNEVNKLLNELSICINNNNEFNFIKAYSGILTLYDDINNSYNNNKKNIFIGTPILESSITIKNAIAVIDDCLFYMKYFRSGKIEKITKSMQIQRKGRIGRVSPGIYICKEIIKENNYLKINNEYLWPYIIYGIKYLLDFNDYFILPSNMNRFKYSIHYLYLKKIDIIKDINLYYKIYNDNICSLIEYLYIYKYYYNNNKIINELKIFEEEPNINNLSIELTKIILNLNIKLEYIKNYKNTYFFKVNNEFEDINNNLIKINSNENIKYKKIFMLNNNIFKIT